MDKITVELTLEQTNSLTRLLLFVGAEVNQRNIIYDSLKSAEPALRAVEAAALEQIGRVNG